MRAGRFDYLTDVRSGIQIRPGGKCTAFAATSLSLKAKMVLLFARTLFRGG